MSLNNFLTVLLEDKEIHVFNVNIVQDNALNYETRKSNLCSRPQEPTCRWDQLKRQDSDSFLIKPDRRSFLVGRTTMNKRSQSDTSFMLMPRRVLSPKQTMQNRTAASSGAKNCTWETVDIQNTSKQKIISSNILDIFLEANAKNKTSISARTSDQMLFGLQSTKQSKSRSSQNGVSKKLSCLHQNLNPLNEDSRW